MQRSDLAGEGTVDREDLGTRLSCLVVKTKNAVAIWPVTGQDVENTKWPTVLYSQQISQNRKILANLNYQMSI